MSNAKRGIYRVTIAAYNSRASYPGAWFTYNIVGWSPRDAAGSLPKTHHPGNYSPGGPGLRYYPEWTVEGRVRRLRDATPDDHRVRLVTVTETEPTS